MHQGTPPSSCRLALLTVANKRCMQRTEDLADSEPQSVLVQAKYLLSWMAYRAPHTLCRSFGTPPGPYIGLGISGNAL